MVSRLKIDFMRPFQIEKKYPVFVSILLIGIISVVIFAGDFLIVEDVTRSTEAIVVIGGDHKPQRVKRAVELYQQGYAPIVIISAGTLVLEGTETLPEAEVMRQQAINLGLPKDVILLEDQSNSTLENALFTKQILESQEIKSIILVTSAYHSRRAKRIFDDVLADNVAISVQPAQPINNPHLWLFYSDEAYVVGYEYWNWIGYWQKEIVGEMTT